jgi:hypothetical protein
VDFSQEILNIITIIRIEMNLIKERLRLLIL